MKPQETTVASTVENVDETVEVCVVESPVIDAPETTLETTQPLISASDPTPLIAAAVETNEQKPAPEVNTPEADTLQVADDLWRQVTHKWEEYFGKDKKSNVTIALLALTIIPTLIATSALLDFLNKIPLLSGVFELVGFGYSGWFVYRYLLLATTRKELTDAIAAWKRKVLG